MRKGTSDAGRRLNEAQGAAARARIGGAAAQRRTASSNRPGHSRHAKCVPAAADGFTRANLPSQELPIRVRA